MMAQEENVIEEHWYSYEQHVKKFKTLSYDLQSKIVIFDLDGVLANIQHRLHFIDKEASKIAGKSVNWQKFFEACPYDKPIPKMLELLENFIQTGYRIYILSGRSAEVEKETNEWFDKYGILYSFMFLRPIKNYDTAYHLKAQWVDKIIELEGLESIFMAFDDEEDNVIVYQNRGIQTFKVEIDYNQIEVK